MRWQLRQPWRDGTTDVVFDPVEFLGRLAVLVPRLRINLILYHAPRPCSGRPERESKGGVLGPRAAWRADVVRCQTPGDDGDAGVKDSATEQAREADPAETARRQARGQCWGSLMERTFGFDVLACPRCGGRLRLIAVRPCEARAITSFACGPAIRARRKTKGSTVVFQRALIDEAPVIERILRHLGVPTKIPAPRAADPRGSSRPGRLG